MEGRGIDIKRPDFSSHCELRVRFRFSWMMNCQLQKLTHALLREDAPIGVSDADATRRWRRSGIAMVDLPAEGSTPTPPPSRPPSLDPPREVATRLGIDRKRAKPKKRHHGSNPGSIKRVALYPVSWRRPSTLAAGAVRRPIGKGSSVTSETGGRGVTGEDKTKTEWPSLTKTCLCKRTTVSWCQTP